MTKFKNKRKYIRNKNVKRVNKIVMSLNFNEFKYKIYDTDLKKNIKSYRSIFKSINLFKYKIKEYLPFLKHRYVSSLKSYYSFYNNLIAFYFLFKKQNSYVQAKYDDKILLQKSVGMYGFEKKEKITDYAKNVLFKKFINNFSKKFFIRCNTIHLYLKGFKKSYIKNVEPLFINLQNKLNNKSKKYSNFCKWLIKKNKIIRICKKKKLKFIQTNRQRRTENNIYIDLIKSRLNSFSYIRCFYISSPNFGGIRLRRRVGSSLKFY
jgi:hypothetical protein